MSKAAPGVRFAEVFRETRETRVEVVLDLDGGTRQDISTGVGFFDHMLQLMAFHGHFDLGLKCEGDLVIDDHHSVEDCGIVLGQAFAQAIAEEKNLARYADNVTPMDEALVQVAIDVSGRGILAYDVAFQREMLGTLATENIREFFRAFTTHSRTTLHLRKLAGDNDHHVAEAIFKGVGRAIRGATARTERASMSSKGQRD
ncbi:MAG: imidazoleglycerol-phosphate dehydratase HisB [Fimbriimonadaceae bacterium]|nr:imidazoleglycerol-phosphate dehydratase HisB [Fimbriimonadaceae bacterium]